MTAQDNDGDSSKDKNKAPVDLLDIFDNSRRNKEMVCTTTDGIFAIGWNQALGNGNGIGDNYRFWGSASLEFGIQFSTRLLENSDAVRLNYGIAMRWQSLRIRGNRLFATQDNVTDLETINLDLDKSSFSQFTLIAPVHLEFGKGELKEYANGIKRYDRDDSWVVGVGGYLGTNASSAQQIKYEREGRNVRNTIENDFEMESFVYGLSAYVGKGDFQIFATYGLNDVFKNSPVQEQMVSIGFRFQ